MHAPSGSTNKQKVGSAESKIRRSKVSVNRDTKMIKLAWVCSNSDDHGSTTTTFDNGTDFIQGMVRYMKLPTIGVFSWVLSTSLPVLLRIKKMR